MNIREQSRSSEVDCRLSCPPALQNTYAAGLLIGFLMLLVHCPESMCGDRAVEVDATTVARSPLPLYVYLRVGKTQHIRLGRADRDGGVLIPNDRLWYVSPAGNIAPNALAQELTRLDIPGVHLGEVDDDLIRTLATVKHLKLVSFVGSFGDAGVASIARLRNLEEVSLTSSNVSDEGLAHLSDLPKLRSLILVCDDVSDAGLHHVSKLRELQVLTLGFTRITDQGLRHLTEMHRLRYLNLVCTGITDNGLGSIGQLCQLETLRLTLTLVKGTGLTHLRSLEKLRNLSLARTSVADAHLSALSEMDTLETLELSSTNISDDGLQHLVGLSSLRKLHLNHIKLKGPGLRTLRRCKTIEELDFGSNPIEDHELAFLKSLANLERLNLDYTQVTAAGVASLTDLPIRILSLEGTEIGPRIKGLGRFRALEEIDLSDSAVDDTVFEDLGRCDKLEVLDMSFCGSITGTGLSKLKAVRSLGVLKLNASNITPEAVGELSHLVQLKRLEVRDTALDHQDIVRLQKAMPRTEIVWRTTAAMGDGDANAHRIGGRIAPGSKLPSTLDFGLVGWEIRGEAPVAGGE